MANPFDTSQLQPYYTRFLGREGSPDELRSHAGNIGGFEGAIGTIVGSPEARDYANRPPAPITPPPATTTDTKASGSLSGSTGEGRRGEYNNMLLDAGNQRGINQFRGFNDDRALSGGDPNSVKDLSRRFFGGQDYDLRGKSKDDLDAWLTGLIPDARAAGMNILDVVGDQMLVETKERGPEWVDYVQNAGGDDPAFQWLTQQEFGNASDGGFGGPLKQLQGMPGGSDMLAALLMNGGLSGSSLMERIQAELAKLLSGQQGPSTPPPQPGTMPIPGLDDVEDDPLRGLI